MQVCKREVSLYFWSALKDIGLEDVFLDLLFLLFGLLDLLNFNFVLTFWQLPLETHSLRILLIILSQISLSALVKTILKLISALGSIPNQIFNKFPLNGLHPSQSMTIFILNQSPHFTKSLIQLGESLLHGRVPMVFDGIISPSEQVLGDLSPPVADISMRQKKDPLFIVFPILFLDVGVEVIMPTLTTLLADPAW